MKEAPNRLLIDIGNTSTSIGFSRGCHILRVERLPSHSATPARIRRVLAAAAGARRGDCGSVLCSVVPRLNPIWKRVLKEFGGQAPVVVDHRTRLCVKVDYPAPRTIGADRLANACAGWARYHSAVIVADFGTALTFDVVTADGRYVGGVIAPGLPLMSDYLAERTALLPHISLEGPFGGYGRSTEEAMRLGAMVGYRGMVRELLRHVRAAMGTPHPRFCATGGYAARALRGLGVKVDILPQLTLDGLILIHEMNR